LCRLRRTWRSPPVGTVCPCHAPCSGVCRLFELTCSSLRVGSACLSHAPRRTPYRLELTCSSPPLGTVCPRHARCRTACRLLQSPWCSPPAHTAACPWPSSRFTPPPKPQLTATRHSQPSSTPSQPSMIRQCTSDTKPTTVAVREQVKRGGCRRMCRYFNLWRGTYGGCVVGEGGQGLLRTLHPQVRRLALDGRFEPTPLDTATRRPHHDGGTPWSVHAALRVGLL
jgi:hypothetical protein